MNSIEFFGLPIVSLGIYKVKDDSKDYEELKISDPKSNLYKKLILKGKIIVGAILVGDIKNSGVFLRLIKERIDISSFKDRLLQENFGYPDIMDFVEDKENIYV
jgi:NAD(P)H-nitrite reductase large subunit